MRIREGWLAAYCSYDIIARAAALVHLLGSYCVWMLHLRLLDLFFGEEEGLRQDDDEARYDGMVGYLG